MIESATAFRVRGSVHARNATATTSPTNAPRLNVQTSPVAIVRTHATASGLKRRGDAWISHAVSGSVVARMYARSFASPYVGLANSERPPRVFETASTAATEAERLKTHSSLGISLGSSTNCVVMTKSKTNPA